MLRRALMLIGILGTVVFAVALLVSMAQPLLVERGARELLWIEVERRVGERIDRLDDSRLGSLARGTLQRMEDDRLKASKRLREAVPRISAAVLINMQDANCECRRRMTQLIEDGARDHLASITDAERALRHVAETAYASVSRQWLREFRIVAGTNAVAFALLTLIAAWRPRAAIQLTVPALLILVAVGLTGYGYLFAQDWLHALLFNDYVGLGYAVWLAGVTALLGDIVLNRSRATTMVLNGLFGAISAPC
jgi:hypothetical protein